MGHFDVSERCHRSSARLFVEGGAEFLGVGYAKFCVGAVEVGLNDADSQAQCFGRRALRYSFGDSYSNFSFASNRPPTPTEANLPHWSNGPQPQPTHATCPTACRKLRRASKPPGAQQEQSLPEQSGQASRSIVQNDSHGKTPSTRPSFGSQVALGNPSSSLRQTGSPHTTCLGDLIRTHRILHGS
jgi:hypothetical protein